MNLYFSDLNKDEIESMVINSYQIIEDLETKLVFEDTNSPQLVLERINKELDDFCDTCIPIVLGLKSEKIKQRHWNELRDHLYEGQINHNANEGLENDISQVP